MKLSFPKNKRLVTNEQFKAVLTAGRCCRDNFLLIYIAHNDCGYSRLGVSVGKSYGNAVERNRFKRLVREVFRQNPNQIPSNYDYLVMPSHSRTKDVKPDFEQIKNSFLDLINKIKTD